MNAILATLRRERASRYRGGLYHKTQVELTYNSNHIEGSRLTHEQTRFMFETNTVGVAGESLRVDDIIHFRTVTAASGGCCCLRSACEQASSLSSSRRGTSPATTAASPSGIESAATCATPA